MGVLYHLRVIKRFRIEGFCVCCKHLCYFRESNWVGRLNWTQKQQIRFCIDSFHPTTAHSASQQCCRAQSCPRSFPRHLMSRLLQLWRCSPLWPKAEKSQRHGFWNRWEWLSWPVLRSSRLPCHWSPVLSLAATTAPHTGIWRWRFLLEGQKFGCSFRWHRSPVQSHRRSYTFIRKIVPKIDHLFHK